MVRVNNDLSSFEEFLRELAWVKVALQDFENACRLLAANSDIGELGDELKTSSHRFGLLRSRLKILYRVYRIFVSTTKRKAREKLIVKNRKESETLK